MNNILDVIANAFKGVINRVRLMDLKKQIDPKCKVSPGFRISNPKNVRIEEYVYIGPNSFMSSFGKIHIKRGTIIGPNLKIYTANHNYADNINSIPYDSKLVIKEVVIEENVWIGESVIILPGVIVGEGSIIGAGSVVVKSIPKYSIAGGNPAKVIKQRPNIEEYLNNKKLDNIYLKIKYGR